MVLRPLLIACALIFCQMAAAQLQLNTAFGNGGVVKIAVDDFTEPVEVINANGDSLLLLANVTHADTLITTDFAVIKLTASGSTDLSFGQNGLARCDFNGMDVSTAYSCLKLDNGAIMVLGAGHSLSNNLYLPACLMKLTAAGLTDSTFGTNGTLTLQFDGIEEFPRVLKKTGNRQLMVAGFSTDSVHQHVDVPAIARINEDGTMDSTFGTNGKAYLRFPNGIIQARHTIGGVLYDILELPDGSYLTAGGYSNALNLIGFINHLTHNGEIDTAFFDGGYLGIDFTPYANSQIIKLRQSNDGSVWFCASSSATQNKDFFTGKLNLTTGDYNTWNTDFGGKEDQAADVQPDALGNIYVTGRTILPQRTSPAWQSDYFAVKYSPAASFPFNGAQFTFSEDTTLQCGAVSSVIQQNGDLICYGFKNKPNGQNELMLISLQQNTLSVEDIPGNNTAIKVFPNPATDKLWVQAGQNEDIERVSLTDVSGRCVFLSQNNSANASVINVSSLPAGVYFLQVQVNNARFNYKVIIN